MSPYLDPVASVFMPTALRSITSALVLKSGGKYPEGFFVLLGTFILMTGNGRRAVFPTLALVAPLTSWSCRCRERTEVIAGFCIVTIRCTTTRERLHAGMLLALTLMIARESRRDFSMK